MNDDLLIKVFLLVIRRLTLRGHSIERAEIQRGAGGAVAYWVGRSKRLKVVNIFADSGAVVVVGERRERLTSSTSRLSRVISQIFE